MLSSRPPRTAQEESPQNQAVPRASSGSGGRYARVCTLPVTLRLPVKGRVGALAAAQ